MLLDVDFFALLLDLLELDFEGLLWELELDLEGLLLLPAAGLLLAEELSLDPCFALCPELPDEPGLAFLLELSDEPGLAFFSDLSVSAAS